MIPSAASLLNVRRRRRRERKRNREVEEGCVCLWGGCTPLKTEEDSRDIAL
jgi:hypothetical protein